MRLRRLASRLAYDALGRRLPSWSMRALGVRRVLARGFCAEVAPTAWILGGARLSSGLTLLHESGVGEECAFYGHGRIVIGEWVRMGPRCIFLTGDHPVPGDGERFADHHPTTGDIVVGDDAFLGAGIVVLPGVTIGPGATIGAGAVVTRDVPAGATAVGNPAKVIRTRTVPPDLRSRVAEEDAGGGPRLDGP